MRTFKYSKIRKAKKKSMSKTWTVSSGSDTFNIIYPARTKIEIVNMTKLTQYN